jgi:hypothetical protein
MSDRVYVIWSFEHDAWWKPHRLGYTLEIEEAGHYSADEANEIVDNANRFQPHEYERAILLEDARKVGPPIKDA